MQLDAWQASVSHRYDLENLTMLAQMEILKALEPYRNKPVGELLQFLDRDLLKLLTPFEEMGRQLSVSYFEKQHDLAAANPATPVKPVGLLVVAAVAADRLNRRLKGNALANAIRQNNAIERNPVVATVPEFTDLGEIVQPGEFLPGPPPDIFVEAPEPILPQPRQPKPQQVAAKEAIKALKKDIKADKITDFAQIEEKVAEVTQSQLYDDDRENLDYYADLEKTITHVKRIPSSGGCAWCRSTALWVDGNSASHKWCKCTTGYVYEGEDEDKFIDPEQQKFIDDYEATKEKIKNGEVKGRLLKQGSKGREVAMKKEIKDAAYNQREEAFKAEEEKLGRPLLKKEQKEIVRARRKESEALAAKLNTGEALTKEEKQSLHGYGLSVEQMRAPKYGQTVKNEDILAAMKRTEDYH